MGGVEPYKLRMRRALYLVFAVLFVSCIGNVPIWETESVGNKKPGQSSPTPLNPEPPESQSTPPKASYPLPTSYDEAKKLLDTLSKRYGNLQDGERLPLTKGNLVGTWIFEGKEVGALFDYANQKLSETGAVELYVFDDNGNYTCTLFYSSKVGGKEEKRGKY